MKVQFFSSVLALALVAGNVAHAGIGEAKDVRIGRDASVRLVRDAEGKLVVEKDKNGEIKRADFLEAEAVKNSGGLRAVQDSLLGKVAPGAKDTRSSSLVMLLEANAKGVMEKMAVPGSGAREVFQLGQMGEGGRGSSVASKGRVDAVDLLTVQALAKDEASITLINKMIADGESVGLTKAIARMLAANPASRALAEKLIENNKQYLQQDMADNVKAGRSGTTGQFIRAKNHLELIRNMAFEFYATRNAKGEVTISRKEALERAIVRLKEGKGESMSRQDVAKLAENLLANNCI